jgi:glycosyltransferase involved in cell wall biosynthesis
MQLRKQKEISVTVFLFTYNHEKFIKKCIESVLNQNTRFKINVVIFDDKSTDRTSLIINNLIKNKPNIKMISSKINLGLGRLCLLKYHGNVVETEYYMLLDGDDYWTDINKIELQISMLEKHRNLIGCGHYSYMVNESDNKKIGEITVPINEVNVDDWFHNLNPVYMHTSSLMWRNVNGHIYNKILQFLGAYSDTFIYFDKLKYGNVGVIPKFMSNYRIHKNGIWNRLSAKEKTRTQKKTKILLFLIGFPKTLFYLFKGKNYKIF